MKKKSVLSLMVVIAILSSIISVPIFADSTPTFRIEGKVALPGNDVAPDGNLSLTLEYRSDKGTADPADDFTATSVIVLMKGSHETSFYWDIPFTGSADAKFILGYSLPETSQYWHKGYYALSGMQYYKEGQMQFHEGAVSGLVITPLKASRISGTVGLPVYTTTQQAVEVDVSAKTKGLSDGTHDDFEAVAKVNITNSAIAYDLKVPTTVTTASYIVMYNTKAADYEKQGWYSTTGTAIKASDATKVDISGENRANINLVLVKKITDPVTPVIKFDLNNDGRVDIKDMILVARAMGSKKKYVEAYDLNKDGVINVIDLKLIKAEIQKDKNPGKMGKDWSCDNKGKKPMKGPMGTHHKP